MLVSPLRCFKVSSLTTPPLIWGGARRAEGMSILISPLGRTIATKFQSFTHQRCLFHRFAVSRFHASKMLVSSLRCFKVSCIKDACFTASLFQGFITHNSSPNLGRCPQGGGSVHPIVNQDSVCLLWGEAEVRVAFNDRAERYHSRNLVTERGVIGQCNLVTERASKAKFQNS